MGALATASSTEGNTGGTVAFYCACLTLLYSVTVWLFFWFFNEWTLFENRGMLKHLGMCVLFVFAAERLRFEPASG